MTSWEKELNAVTTLSFYRFYWILALKELFMREFEDVFLALENSVCWFFPSAIHGLVSTSSLFRLKLFDYGDYGG